MKKICLLVAIVAMISCQQEKPINYAIISGKIENVKTKKLTLFSQYDTSKKVDISFAEDGTFLDTLKMDSNFFVLRQDNNLIELYAPNGSKSNISYNATKKDSTLQITGSLSAINNYLLAKGKLSKELMGDQKEMFLKDEAAFKEHILKIKTAEEDLLFKTDGISEDFSNMEKNSINYEYLATLNNYKTYHGYYSKNRAFEPSENFLDDLKGLDLENEKDFLNSKFYRDIVSSKLRDKTSDLVKQDSTISSDIAYLKVVSELNNQKIKNKLLYDDARYGITYTDNLEEYYKLFSKNSTDEENNTKIAADYKKLKSLAKGSPSPKFSDYENNAGGKMSLEDLKGSYVYIDVWATWCGPCIAEIPSLKKVEKEFHNKNIKFVSVSIDTEDAYDKWKKMIVDRELGGIQLLAENAWKSQFVQDYMIKGIPRFILLDAEGKIISANAPRPSNKKLVETLNSLNL